MTGNPNDFEVALRRIAERELAAAVAEASRGLALAVLEGVVSRTPVRIGRTRANWQVGPGQPPAGVLDETDKDGRSTVARGRAAIARARPYETIWIVNNLPHIGALEQGTPRQAPHGIVALTLATLRR